MRKIFLLVRIVRAIVNHRHICTLMFTTKLCIYSHSQKKAGAGRRGIQSEMKSSPRVVTFSQLTFQPRFAFPEMAEVVEVAGERDRSQLAGGFVRFKNARIPWELRYDELILVLEGQLTIETAQTRLTASSRGSIWLPEGTKLTYVSDHALVFYSIHPSDWAKKSHGAI